MISVSDVLMILKFGIVALLTIIISAAIMFGWMWIVFCGPFPINWIAGISFVLVWIYLMGKSLMDMYNSGKTK